MKKIPLLLFLFVLLSGFTYTDIDKTIEEVNQLLGGNIDFKSDTTPSLYDIEAERLIYSSDVSNIFLNSEGTEVESLRIFFADRDLVIKIAEYLKIDILDDDELLRLLSEKKTDSGSYMKIHNETLIEIKRATRPNDKNDDDQKYLIILEFDNSRFDLLLENHFLRRQIFGWE